MKTVFVGCLALAVLVSGCCGVSRYLEQSKKAEGKNGVGIMGRGAISCAQSSGGKLPATSAMVPATLAQVSGKKYMSSPADWGDPAFKCLKFSMSEPQYFQYQWVLKSPTSGVARAVADLDGDGKPDSTIELDVTCAAQVCNASPTLRETE
jgi:hypothetical protein